MIKGNGDPTVGEMLLKAGISRRGFIQVLYGHGLGPGTAALDGGGDGGAVAYLAQALGGVSVISGVHRLLWSP